MKVDLIVVPFDSGIRDVRMGRGPQHLLDIGIVEALERSNAQVRVRTVEPASDTFGAEIKISFEIQQIVSRCVSDAVEIDALPVVLSGNCNTAVGTVAGLTAASGTPPMVCWLDAHGDFNTPETTTSGFLDGMAVAMVAGRCWNGMTATVPGFDPVPEARVLMIGARDLDSEELRSLEASEVQRVQISDAPRAVEERNPSHIYLHVDMDVFDTSVGRANSFAIEGGVTRDAFMSFARTIRNNIGALAITAYDPSCDENNTMGRLAVDIVRGIVTGDGLS